MKIRIFLLPLLLLTLFAVPRTLPAQGVIPMAGQEVQQEAEGDSIRILPFASISITDAFSSTNALLNESGSKQLTEEQITSFTTEEDTLFSVIENYLDDSTIISLEDISVRELDNISQRTSFFNDELEGMEKSLSDRANEIEETVVLLSRYIKRWELTVESLPGEEMPEARLQRIDRSIFRLDSVRSILQANIGVILVQQDRISDEKTKLDDLLARIRDKKSSLGESLTAREMPGFFRDLSSLNDSTLLKTHVELFKKAVSTDSNIMKKEYIGDTITYIVVLILMLVFGIWYKKHLAKMMAIDTFELTEMHLAFIYAPGATVFFLVALLTRFILPGLPHSYFLLNVLIMMVPMTMLVIKLYGSRLRTWTMVLVVLYGLTMVYELSYRPDILLRIFLMGFSIAALWLFVWVFIKRPFETRISGKFMSVFFRLLIFVFIVLLIVAIIANLVGAFRLAEFFTLLPVQITILALGVMVATRLAETLIFLALASNHLQKANVIREEFDTILRKTVWLADLFLWLFFVAAALNIFRLKEIVFDWGRGILTNGLSLGNVEISLGNILIFIFVIWLSIMTTRIVKSILEKDVFTRVETAKGIPSTVILLMRIVLISGGFFLAAAAAGMKLTNLSIVLGAFSVGIGFGLQNIFNNMVSGLILAFERPIKVGDVVQVGELVGIVRSIGLRSSTVKSFDGAEVIVPNGNLISDQMINWTLSDYNRRMDIRIGVAYGTSPELVLEIMERIAAEHPGVRKKPLPKAYFLEFGDSSLNFRLLAWTHIDNRLEVESEINVILNTKLEEAGIEIPFPQTDLHIRSDDTKTLIQSKSASKSKPADKAKPPAKG